MAKLVHSLVELEHELVKAGQKLVIIDFFADWCAPCKMLSPKFESLANKEAGKFRALKVDVDECEDITSKYDIRCMPTFIAVMNGVIVDRVIGANIAKVKALIPGSVS